LIISVETLHATSVWMVRKLDNAVTPSFSLGW